MNTSEMKQKLEEEKASLVTSLAEVGAKDENGDWQAVPDKDNVQEPDPNDVADKMEDFNERSATLDTLEKRLREVDSALAKIEAGNYGVCEVSGEPIEEDRLNANPAAKTCKMHINS